MHTWTTRRPQHSRPMRLAFGMTLLGVGAVSLLHAFGLFGQTDAWKLWPIAFIIAGVVVEIDAARRGRFGSGLIPIGIGTWLLAGSYHLFHLTHETAFPLGIVVVGAGLVIEAILEARRTTTNKEIGHGKH
jgi:cell wall-active antibiotic response 4TMS protein YvqF